MKISLVVVLSLGLNSQTANLTAQPDLCMFKLHGESASHPWSWSW